MAGDIGAAQAEHGGGNEAGDAEADGGEERLSHASILPSSFVVRAARELADVLPPPRRALDVAMGRGRHALVLAEAGFTVFGVDRRLDSLHEATSLARARGYQIRAWCADLTAAPLPVRRFELIVVTRYLQRDLFEPLKAALTPGGAIVYETFTEAQRAHGRGPTSADHLLRAGELRQYFAHWDVLFDEEVLAPDAVARIVARRPM